MSSSENEIVGHPGVDRSAGAATRDPQPPRPERAAAHTPGPWLASRFSADVEGPLGRVVALCDVGPRHGQFRITGDEAKANARLIAAAPDMLHTLCGIAGEASGQHADPLRTLQAIEAYARAAIAKAEAV